MAPTHALYDVDPYAITLCKKGANRQTILLRKSADVPEVDDAHKVETPERPILKSNDDNWKAFYVIVAEPGAEEDGGMGADGIVDVWKSNEEIRAAAHRFLKNNAYVNAQHDAPALEDCKVVESAVALAKIKVGDATIPEGAWYVGIEPGETMRKAIDDGEVTGVSIEGTGFREAIAKASYEGADKCPGCKGKVAKDKGRCPNCGAASPVRKAESGKPGINHTQITPENKKKLSGLVAHYRKKPHPFRACVRDNTKRFGKDRAEKVCAVLKDVMEGTTKWRNGGGVKKEQIDFAAWDESWADALVAAGVDDEFVPVLKAYMDAEAEAHELDDQRGALRKMWDKLMSDEPVPDSLRKDVPDFAQRVALVDVRDAGWRAWDTLSAVIHDATRDEDVDDPKPIIERSVQQFADYLLAKLDGVSVSTQADVKKSVGLPLPDDAGSIPSNDRPEDTVSDERIEKIEKAVADQADAMTKLIGLVEKLTTERKPADEQEPTKGDLKKALDDATSKLTEFAGKLDTIEQAVDAIAEGESSQSAAGEPVKKSTTDRPLAGLFD